MNTANDNCTLVGKTGVSLTSYTFFLVKINEAVNYNGFSPALQCTYTKNSPLNEHCFFKLPVSITMLHM